MGWIRDPRLMGGLSPGMTAGAVLSNRETGGEETTRGYTGGDGLVEMLRHRVQIVVCRDGRQRRECAD